MKWEIVSRGRLPENSIKTGNFSIGRAGYKGDLVRKVNEKVLLIYIYLTYSGYRENRPK